MTESASIFVWILFFYVYCFLGWCVESLYVSYFQKKWVNRGFMRGPYIPLYGTGALMVTYITLPVKHSILLTFVIGAISATILEYITGVCMEALFKVRYWDYSDHRFNINGQVCLLNTIEWGFLSVFLVFVLDKPVARLVYSMNESLQMVLVIVISLIFWTDFIRSVEAAFDVRDMIIKMTEAKEEIYRLQRRLDVIVAVADDSFDNWKEEQKDKFEDRLENLGDHLENLGDHLETLGDRLENAEERLTEIREALEARKAERRLMMQERINNQKKKMLLNSPSATSKKFKEAFEELRAYVEEKK